MNSPIKKLKILCVRYGVELSIEEAQEELIIAELQKKNFVRVNGRLVNRSDLVGIFEPEDMEGVIRRRNGQWQDKNGKWRNKGDRLCSGCNQIIPYGKICGNCQ